MLPPNASPRNGDSPSNAIISVAYNTADYGAGFYCDGGAGGTGTFRPDAGCWTGTQPTIQVTTA